MKIEYVECDIRKIMNYFAEGFSINQLRQPEWFIDSVKNTVVFKLYVQEESDTTK